MEVKSEVKEEPLFRISNYTKPTSKNVLIWGDILVSIGAMIGAASIASMSMPIAVAGMIVSGIGIIMQRLTREKPKDTLVQAIVDIKEEKAEELEKKEDDYVV